jgi:class 3 adenylate cyclase
MRLGYEEQEQQAAPTLPAAEARYDRETLRRVTVLAQRLQDRQGETLTAAEIEAIGGEVGLERSFIRQALGLVTEKTTAVQQAVAAVPSAAWRRMLTAFTSAWWAAGWTIPFLMIGANFQGGGGDTPLPFFMGWGIYIGVGVLASSLIEDEEKQKEKARRRRRHEPEPVQSAVAAEPATAPLSRTVLLERLFALQHQLEAQKRHYAFLSLDVVGSTEMKLGADPLAMEYSFGQFRTWAEGVIRAAGGALQSTAGDGMMAVFEDDAAALRAARRLQSEIPAFNSGINRLSQPFSLRVGVSAGEVALEPGMPLGHLNSAVVDRAAALQKRGLPGDVVVSAELAATALVELGGLAPLPEEVHGQPAFSWLAARRAG